MYYTNLSYISFLNWILKEIVLVRIQFYWVQFYANRAISLTSPSQHNCFGYLQEHWHEYKLSVICFSFLFNSLICINSFIFHPQNFLEWHDIVKKIRFPLNAFLFLCPTWTKNVEWYLTFWFENSQTSSTAWTVI